MSDIAFSVIINNNGIDDIIFKTIMLKGEKGNSVDHVSKTSTSGKVDTYTIYLTDGTVGGTFTVTNGEDGAPVNIDDTVTALDKTWSSSKLSGMIKEIDDTDVDSDKLWSSAKISSLIPQTATIEDVAIASFADGADDVPVSELIVDIEAVQAGSGEPSPTNVRAISGFSTCKVTRTGKNLFDKTNITQGKYLNGNGAELNSSSYNVTDYIEIKGGAYITISGETTGGSAPCICYYDKDKTFLNSEQHGGFSLPHTYLIPSNAFYFRESYESASTDTFQIEIGSSATAYEPFNDDAWEMSLYETVYGGTLDVAKGVLTVTHGEVDLGDLSWSKQDATYPFFYAKIDDVASNTENLLCSIYRVGAVNANNDNDNAMRVYNTNILRVRNMVYASSTATQFKTAMAGIKLYYELATPIVVNNLHSEIVKTLAGNNNIFADTGDVNKLVYFKAGSETVARMIEAMTYLRS